MTPARGMIVAAMVALAGCRDRGAAGESAIAPAPAGLISDAMVAEVIERAPMEQYFGVAMNGKKIGWTRVALRRAAPGEPGGIVTETELALHHREGAPTTSVELRFYAASAPYRLVAVDRGGANSGGRQPARSAESLHGIVAQLYAEPAWLIPGRSQTFPSYDPDVGRDDSDTVRVAEVTRERIAGVDTDVAVIESQSDGESAVSRIHLGHGGVALRAAHGTFALELQSRAQAQSDVVGFDMFDDAVPVDRPLGDAAALSRLELIVGVSSGFVVPESPRQQVERLADGRYRVMLTLGPGKPVTPEERRDALAVTPTVDAGVPTLRSWYGEGGRVIGDLTGLLATLKGLPLAYNRDLQEDKEPLFDAIDTLHVSLLALTGLVAGVTFVTEAIRAQTDDPLLAATDLAELLVRRGTPFREAHAVVGALVRASLDGDRSFAELVADEPRLGAEGAALLAPGAAVAQRTTPGAGGPEPLGAQLGAMRALLARQAQWLG